MVDLWVSFSVEKKAVALVAVMENQEVALMVEEKDDNKVAMLENELAVLKVFWLVGLTVVAMVEILVASKVASKEF
jgi:hypothetical protein